MGNNKQAGNKKILRRLKSIFAILIMAVSALAVRSYYIDNGSSADETPQERFASVEIFEVKDAEILASRSYIGKVESIQSVVLKPQITGQIEKVNFKEGSIVEEGQLLFSVDDRQYKAAVDMKKAELAKAEANYMRASKYYERTNKLVKSGISESDVDMAHSESLQAKAAVEQAKVALRIAELDLSYTKITAPISGQIGKASTTKGNYVTPSSSELASIVQMNPIRVSFALPDKDYIENIEMMRSPEAVKFDATLTLSNNSDYPYKGEPDYQNNIVDEKTGTITTNLQFKNDKGLLVPGSMVRITIASKTGRTAPVIPQTSMLADETGDFVYVVSADIASKRNVVIGMEMGSMYEVVSGLESGERIVSNGLQSVADGVKIKETVSQDAPVSADVVTP